MTGCWSWPQIWASSDEPAADVGIVVPLLEQDLDGQVAAQIGVAALEDRPHAAVADLAQDLVAAGIIGPLGRRRMEHGGSASSFVSRSKTRGTSPSAALSDSSTL
jgi:hypothetical protein